ncbi:MAG: hypothetical protein ACOC1Q_01965 [Desulfosalsimonas sp.]
MASPGAIGLYVLGGIGLMEFSHAFALSLYGTEVSVNDILPVSEDGRITGAPEAENK